VFNGQELITFPVVVVFLIIGTILSFICKPLYHIFNPYLTYFLVHFFIERIVDKNRLHFHYFPCLEKRTLSFCPHFFLARKVDVIGMNEFFPYLSRRIVLEQIFICYICINLFLHGVCEKCTVFFDKVYLLLDRVVMHGLEHFTVCSRPCITVF